jgi:cytosine/adenosine deaminase-related metal-dependent hydrolase
MTTAESNIRQLIVHEGPMSVLDIGAAGATQWAIVDTLYFNSFTHSFVCGDIEIDDSRITRIVPPRTSRRACALPGNATVCLPGLIDSDAGLNWDDWSSCSQELALHGVTTAGVFCRNLSACEAFTGHEGVRRFLYVELGENGALEGNGGDSQHGFESFERTVNAIGLNRCEVFPAVVPGEIWSAATLLAAASIAERLGRRLCVRLCSTTCDARNYRETRFFTEVGLLSYLSLLSQATIFNLSQLSRRDVMMLNDSSANLVCAPGALSDSLIELHHAPLSLKDRAMGFSINQDAIVDSDRYAALILLSMALMHRSDDVMEACHTVVDSLTRSAALALGIRDVGAIAADMKADLCLFDRSPEFREHCDGRYFIKLLVGKRPRDVLIDGLPVVVDGLPVRERAQV